MSTLVKEITAALNKASCDNACNTPDYVLAQYLLDCLAAYMKAAKYLMEIKK